MSGSPRDDEPFVAAPEFALSGRPTANAVRRDEASRSQSHRARVIAWATGHGFEVQGSVALADVDGVRVRIALYEVLEAAATVRGTALLPFDGSFTVERKTWTQRLLSRLASTGARTGDVAFDATHTIETPDGDWVGRFLDERCRAAFHALPASFLAAYRKGEIEVWVGHRALAGTHLLQAMEAVAALGRAAVPDAPYR
jgi:hypothetical protein